MFNSDELTVTLLRFTALAGGAAEFMSRERGSGSVLALLLSSFCLLAMLSWQRALQVSLELVWAPRHYLQAFHQAESSLAWGISQHWPARHGDADSIPPNHCGLVCRPAGGDMAGCCAGNGAERF